MTPFLLPTMALARGAWRRRIAPPSRLARNAARPRYYAGPGKCRPGVRRPGGFGTATRSTGAALLWAEAMRRNHVKSISLLGVGHVCVNFPQALKRFRFDRKRSRFFSLTAADPRVRACAGAPDDRRAAVAA